MLVRKLATRDAGIDAIIALDRLSNKQLVEILSAADPLAQGR